MLLICNKILFFLVIFSVNYICSAQTTYDYVGGLKLNDSTLISYKISFVENQGKVTGHSITDIGGEHETKSNIYGEYNVSQSELMFREVGIVYTKSPVSQEDFCFLNATLNNFTLGKSKKAKADFKGLFSDNSECVNGEIILNSMEKAEERMKKVADKIAKSRKVPDSLKDKLKEVNLMDSFKLNILKNNQTMSVFTKSKKVLLTIYDGGKEDGDRINISANGAIILKNFEVTKSKKNIELNLPSNKTSIVINAVNEGEILPNTVVVEIKDEINLIKSLSNLKTGESTQVDVLKR